MQIANAIMGEWLMSLMSRQNDRNVASLGFIGNWRFAFLVGMFVVAAAVLATEAVDPILDPPAAEPAGTEMAPAAGIESLTGVTSPAGVPDQAVVSLAGELPTHNPQVGKVPGSAGVSGGAATYTIPIVVPPGRRGMQPELSLSYSSSAGNGNVGMGWSLGGLSAISRCPSNIEQDGAAKAIDLTAGDKLCFEGQRLVAASGTYGQVNATYATEINSFARVTQLGGALSSGSAYFKVELKSGEILYYGGNSTAVNPARVILGGTTVPLSWNLERKQDRLGNLIRYLYTDYGSGESLLSSILYTGFGTTDGNRKVSFTYEARPSTDISVSYIAGGLSQQSKRLSLITTWVGTQKIFDYDLAYVASQVTGRSLLNTVQLCGYSGTTSTCRPATQMTWENNPLNRDFKAFREILPSGVAQPGDTVTGITKVADYNGDGAVEFKVLIDNATDASKNGYYLASFNADREMVGARIQTPETYTYNGPDYWDNYQHDSSTSADFNNDGRADRLVGYTPVRVASWTGPLTATTYATAFTETSTNLTLDHTKDTIKIGDFNGDGWSDIVVRHTNASAGSCGASVLIYLNQKNRTMPSFSQAGPSHCLNTTAYPNPVNTEQVMGVGDWNGDGLADIFIQRTTVGTAFNRILLSTVTGGAYSYQAVNFSAQFPASDSMTGLEANARLTWRLTDVNGDGLSDFVYVRPGTDGTGTPRGFWTIRLNTGKGLSARLNTTSFTGLEFCALTTTSPDYSAYCQSTWTPRHFFNQMDTDGDGREEILVPRTFASRLCTRVYVSIGGGETEPRYFCPERPDLATFEFPGGYVALAGGSGFNAYAMYANGYGYLDRNAYWMAALRFNFTASGVSVQQADPHVIETPASAGSTDYFSDGLADFAFGNGCAMTAAGGCSRLYKDASGRVLNTTESPTIFPNGDSISTRDAYVMEGEGVGMNPNGKTPVLPELLQMVTDGLGAQTLWTYYPLSSKAGRTSGETPLYTVPLDSTRYVDERHVYFTSSMPVVSDMSQTDDTGDFRSWRYGYSEAMYHTRGRGFQGFRTIIEEDESSGVRTTTTYSQKFPLTSQVEQIATSALSRAYNDANGIFKLQKFFWRCNRANRADTTACVPPNGTAVVVFPFLDEQQTYKYDATVAAAVSGTPAQLGYQRSIAADDSTCAGGLATTSGYDANGNLTASVVLTYDGNGSGTGNGSGGTREFIASHCVRTRSVYAAADTTNWWLDKLNSRSVTTGISYNSTIHPLPSGVANPQQTVTTSYTWNTNRTPNKETVQSGVANQQKLTTFGYPASNNYGLPTSITMTASGDSAGPRQTSTTYSADGYFPATVANALGHQSTATVRAADGQPSLVTDANGLRTIYQYDQFGFNTLTKYRGATDSEYVAPDRKASIVWCSTVSCFQPGMYRIYVVQDGSPTAVKDFDAIDHETGGARRLMDGTWSAQSKRYDSAGRLTSESEIYRSGEPRYYTLYEGYDVAGRLLSKVSPRANQDGRGDMVTTYTYSGRTTNIQVCGENDTDTTKCLNLSRTQDSLGRFVETVDAAAGVTKFWYDGNGNALAIRDAKNAVISAAYNAIGQRTAVDDPNQGDWSFGYDALGELLSQTDARNITTTTSYDKLSRPLQRSATYDYDGTGATDAVVDSWAYDPTYGKGFEGSNTRTVNTTVLRSESTIYDTLARPRSRTITQLRSNNSTTDSVTQETAYDSYYGRPKAQSFGNAEVLWLQYSKYGDLTKESNPSTGKDYRVVNTVDGRGQPTQETWGAGNLTVTRSYLPQTGQVASIDYASALNPSLRTFDYAYDVFGNLVQQDLNGGATRETYNYDAVQRLTEATRTGGASGTVDYAYDAIGNLTSKSDFSTTAAGAYSYTGGSCGGGPNAVKSVALKAGGSRAYCYDAAGNLTGDDAGLVVRYDHTQRPLRITRGTIVQSFDYAPDGSRFRESGTDGEVQFYGPLERRFTPTAQDKLYAASNAVITQTGATRTVQYLLTDRLGSVDAVVDGTWTVVEARGYDAFGKPRTGTWADATPPRLGTTANTPHGFTGHEHLNSLELIHMNGRVYDYNLGRFMEVDPIIQNPLNSQALNPYSYIGNNPLSGVDPTGYALLPACGVGTHITGSGPSCDSMREITIGGNEDNPTLGGGHRNNGSQKGPAGIGTNRPQEITSINAVSERSNKSQADGNIAGTPQDDLFINGSSLGQESQESGLTWEQIRALTLAGAHEVDTRDYSRRGESFEEFNFYRNLKVQSLTEMNKYEYASAMSFRFSLNDSFGLEGQWAAAYSTSNSALSSAAVNRVVGDGWIYMPDQDMHSHGIIKSNYKLNHLEAAYANWATSSSIYHSGMKVNSFSENVKLNADIWHFSHADQKSQHPLWLSTPRGPVRGEPGNWP